MLRYIVMVLFYVVCMQGLQPAITDNDYIVYLDEDSTWFMDSIWFVTESTIEPIVPLAMTPDSQTVLLRVDSTWGYAKRNSIDIDTIPEIASPPIKSVPDDAIDIELFEKLCVREKPVPISMPTPRYPEKARQLGIEGTAIVQMLVDVTGHVTLVKLIKSSGNEWLDEAACDATMKAVFKPAKIRGRKVRVRVIRPVKFQLTP
jgi:TonB family protein